ncbi:hypothetical protein M9H77_15543 [Catharanthus roseus]|uniref:Uncharacterized protein n=1 Tax=Catharanthus roseus TaxID=4058 RepID=A0ACC0AZG0_CATRO|nr:hypothetical protein M9H77_15543 [Catharanthus roseus]
MKAFSSRVVALIKKSRLFISGQAHGHFYTTLSPQNPLTFSLSFILENFASILDRCLDVDYLKKVHACIVVNGLGNDCFLGSKLFNLYASFDLVTESRWVFNKVIDGNPSLWKSVFLGYSRAGHNDEVLRVYLERKRRRIGVDSSAITFCLKSCVELGNFEFGRIVHSDTFKFGLNGGCFVGSSLIGLYAKYDDIKVAAKVFDEITKKDIVVYTSMVTGYAQAGDNQAFKAFRVLRNMQKEELEPNRVTLVSLLQAASHLGALKEGKSIHAYAIRRGIGWSDEVFETSLMDMYMKSGPLDKAAFTFSKMSRKTIGSWNALIAGYLKSQQPLEALQVFHQMVQENQIPDLITLANGLLSCAYLEDLARGKCIHSHIIRNSVQLDLVATTALIDMYSKCNRLSLAKEVFDKMDRKDTGSFNVMIAGYLENGFACQVVEEFQKMIRTGLRPNVSTILNLLSALSNFKDTRQVKSVHGFALGHGFEANTEIANLLIHIYTNCCSISCARKVFDRTQSKDIVSWTSMITGYVIHGLVDEAVALFRLMQHGNISPDSICLVSLLQLAPLGYLCLTREIHCYAYRVSLHEDKSILNSLLTTYSKCGKLIMARNLFDHMAEHSLVAFNSMISAYGMHGNCVEALKLFEQMKEDMVLPDELTFRSLLSACSHSGFVDEGLSVFRSMKEEYHIVPSDEHYGCVVDLLSRAGHLEEAYELVKCVSSSGNASAIRALLAACRVHGNTNLGETIGSRLLELEPQSPGVYNLVSNLYAEQERWERVAACRGNAKARGLKSVTGYSVIDYG